MTLPIPPPQQEPWFRKAARLVSWSRYVIANSVASCNNDAKRPDIGGEKTSACGKPTTGRKNTCAVPSARYTARVHTATRSA